MRAKGESKQSLVSITQAVILQFKWTFKTPFLRMWGYINWFAMVTSLYVGGIAIWPSIEYWLPNTTFRGFFLPWATGVVVFFSMLFIFYVIYRLEHPFFEQFKSNKLDWPWYSDPNWDAKWRHAMNVTLKNNFIWAPAFSGLLAYGGFGKGRTTTAEIPSFPVFLAQILFFILVEELVFYIIHRIMHHPKLYPKLHKIHHEFNNAVTLAAEYAHPIEYILGNMLPIGVGPTLLFRRFHYLSMLTFLTMRLIFSVENHCGYDFPWAMTRPLPFESTAHYHNYHHLKNNGNYCSASMIWDSIFGTNDAYFEELEQEERSKKNKANKAT